MEWVAFPTPGDVPNPGIEPGSLALQADALPSEPPGSLESESQSVISDSLQPHGLEQSIEFSRQEYGVDSLSLLQGIFPTQGSNLGLLHCRRILYQMSHKGSSFSPFR